MMKNLIAAAMMAGGTLVASSPGVAQADDVAVVGADGVDEYYFTQEECAADGPKVRLQEQDQRWPYWFCTQEADGKWYLWNTDDPSPHDPQTSR
ncbi:hypothetical protein ABIA30_003650 [Mycobacterium sp. MAA66]|uniref:hypothetical protein n=1 Tax=Mycobacterium sp. MAA66 TaxID=3156297 RepID=UPI0035189BFF